MKVRAKETSYMDDYDDKRAWIIKGQIYDLIENSNNEYVFKSEIAIDHLIDKRDLYHYFEEVHDKPNICKILGIEVEESFNIKGIACNPCKVQKNTYYVVDKNNDVLHAKHLLRAINDTSIVEKIKYTDEQKEIFKALKMLGYSYIARDSDYSIYAFEKKPTKKLKYYWSSEDIVSFDLSTDKILNQPHLNFIDWSDNEPFEIPEVE